MSEETILGGDPAAQPAGAPAASPDPLAESAAIFYGTDALDGAQPAEPAQPPEAHPQNHAAPAEYQPFTLPEGMPLDQDALDSFLPLARDLGLSQEAAQRAVSLHAETLRKGAEAQRQEMDRQAAAWSQALKADRDFGGRAFESNVALARSALSRFGSPDLTEALVAYGLGNHPGFVKFCHRIGQALSEDRYLPGGSAASPRDPAEIFYSTNL
jgi:hypothetical protein